MTLCKTTETLLRIRDVSLELGGKTILRNINAEIRDIVGHGQVVSILGPSGIGKTQLFKLIAGLRQPTTGTVAVYDVDLCKEVPVHAGLVGVVAQNYPLLAHRTVLGNLLVASKRMKKETLSHTKERVMSFLERFNIADRAGFYPSQLSGGQRQRVAIIQQLLCSEHYLLMDEPFSGLDLVMKRAVVDLITEVANMDERNTIIVVTHGVDEALMVSDSIWIMGRDRDHAGNVIPGAYLKDAYDLADMGLAWQPESELLTNGRLELEKEIRAKFVEL